MSNDNNQAYAGHHYIQKAFLDKFAEKSRIDVIHRQTGKVRPNQRTDAVAKVRGFYNIELESGDKDGSFEAAFNKEIEEPGLTVINNMTSIFPYVPHGQERSVVAYYIAFQYLRTFEAKKRFQSGGALYASIELFNKANDPEELKAYLESKGRASSPEAVAKLSRQILDDLNNDDSELVPHNNLWLSSLKTSMDHIAPILVERFRWHLFYFDEPTLVTSDHPVVLRSINGTPSGGAPGFLNADEVMFALSKNHALMLTTDDSEPERVFIEPAKKSAEMLNYFVTQSSYREIYSHPSLTASYSGKALGRRPINEMSGGIDHPDLKFIKKYTGLLDSDSPHR